MFDYKHYVPILKTKQGELWALRHLMQSTKGTVTPLLELDNLPKPRKQKTPPKKPRPVATLSSHIGKKLDAITKSWGTDDQFFFDLNWVGNSHSDSRITTGVFDEARARGLLAIPVATLSQDASVLSAIANIVATDGRGVMLRVTPEESSKAHLIDAMLKVIGVASKNAHLLMDYRTRPMELHVDVASVAHLNRWMTFSAASGAFPATLSKHPHNTWHDMSRDDWRSWLKGIRTRKLGRNPAFADYTVRVYGPPAEGGNPPVVMRYACLNKWLIRQDGHHMDGDAPEMRNICASLVGRPEFLGAGYSVGDLAIQNIADGTASTGSPSQWVQIAVNHHLELTVQGNLPLA